MSNLKENLGRDIDKMNMKIISTTFDFINLHRDLHSAILCAEIHERHPSLIEVISFDGHVWIVKLAARTVVIVSGVIAERIVSCSFDPGL